MKKIGVIINNQALNASKADGYLNALKANGLEYELYQTDADVLNNAIEKAILVHPIILIGGGDGSIRSAAQMCANTEVTLGVLPLGTMNHFAKELNLPNTAEELVQALLKFKTTTIDLAEVNNLIFINNSSIGFYPDLAEKRDYYTRFYSKWFSYIPSLIDTYRIHRSYRLFIQGMNLGLNFRTSFFMVSNNLYSYQFPLTFSREKFNQKLLGIYFIKLKRLFFSHFLYSLFQKKKVFEIIEATLPVTVHVKGKKRINISLDGDAITTSSPLVYKILPGALKVLTKN